MDKEVEMLDASDKDFAQKLDFALWSTGGSSDYRNDRERPYNGQSWTHEGKRGQTEVKGVTMRDIGDCFIRAILGFEESDKTWRPQDVYKMDFSKIDPLALKQNMLNNIEKMMGIFPNIKSGSNGV